MEFSDALVTAGIAVASSVGTAFIFVWRAGRYLKGLEDKITGFEKSHEEHEEEDEKRHAALQKDFDDASKNSEESWRELNRTLGKIEGALELETPPPRRRQKSYPGAE